MTRLRKPLAVEHMAITLWILVTTSEYCTVAHLLGVARRTSCVVVHETCKTIIIELMTLYISSPAGDQQSEVVQGFKDKWGFPQ